jgi:hypothetical protein
VEQLLEQAGFATTKQQHQDQNSSVPLVKIQRILPGKIGTRTKQETPSTAFITVANDMAGLKLSKKFNSMKDSQIRVELAYIQKVVERTTVRNADTSSAGTWLADPAYLQFENRGKAKPASEERTAGVEGEEAQPPTKEVSPLVAHIMKQMQANRIKQLKAKKDSRKRKAAGATSVSAEGEPKPPAQKQAGSKPPRKKTSSSNNSVPGKQQQGKAGVGGAKGGGENPRQRPRGGAEKNSGLKPARDDTS